MKKNIESLNKFFKSEYEQYGGIDLLIKYVMSETIAPIEDYTNVANIVKNNVHTQISGDLLIIGAYSAIGWTNPQNELLNVLNVMYPYFPDEGKAIIHYLNSNLIYTKTNMKGNSDYLNELYKTLDYDVPFVNNRLRIAEHCPKESVKYYAEALKNIQVVYSKEDVMQFPIEHFLQPRSFINEHILGTHISYVNYKTLSDKIKL